MTENCILCSRPLLDLKSKTRGIGPECYNNFRRRIAGVCTADLTESQAMSMLDNNDLDIIVSKSAWSSKGTHIYFKTDEAPFIHHITAGPINSNERRYPSDTAMLELTQSMGYVVLADDSWYRYQHLTVTHEWLDEPPWMTLFNGSIHLDEIEILDFEEENELYYTIRDRFLDTIGEYHSTDVGGTLYDYYHWCYTIGGAEAMEAFEQAVNNGWATHDLWEIGNERLHSRLDAGDEVINGLSNPLLDLDHLREYFPEGWRGSPAEAEVLYAEFLRWYSSPTDWNYTHLSPLDHLTKTVEGWLRRSGRM